MLSMGTTRLVSTGRCTQKRGHPRKGTPRDGSTQGRLHLEVGTPKKGCTQRQELIHNGENMDPSTELLPRFIIFSVFAWKDKTSFGSFAPKLSFASRHHEFQLYGPPG